MNEILNEYSVSVQSILNEEPPFQNVLNNIPIYVIHLKSDIFRKSYITYLFKRLHINYMLISVELLTNEKINKYSQLCDVNCSLSQFGCVLSHLWCLKNAIFNNFPKFIIFEDDVVFHGDFLNRINKYLNTPFDMVMLGACDFQLQENKKNMNKKWGVYFPKQNALGAHANLYTLSFAKTLYNWKISHIVVEFDRHYDMFYSTHKIAVCYPNLVICELSTSNIQHYFGPCNKNLYNNYIKKRPFFCLK